eukprot:TRINITY_DN40277_c0_g1_i1.p1 TRINITY_DN40277_c0_g1~~TRINITY_DN40277_c0_g1_i1.p1  ORF type:complete len:539 (-),score=61.36 TRINITY_DN40277_c0_g1_i1:16-1632(-)
MISAIACCCLAVVRVGTSASSPVPKSASDFENRREAFPGAWRIALHFPEHVVAHARGGNYYHFLVDEVIRAFDFIRRHDLHHECECVVLIDGRPSRERQALFKTALFSLCDIRYVTSDVTVADAASGFDFLVRLPSGFQRYDVRSFRWHVLRQLVPVAHGSGVVGNSAAIGFAQAQPQPLGVVWVSRRSARFRRCLNEGEAVQELKMSLGFNVTLLDPGELPLLRQIAVFATTSAVVALHGAGLSNAVFMPPASRVVEVMPHGFHSRAIAQLLEDLLHYEQVEAVPGASVPSFVYSLQCNESGAARPSLEEFQTVCGRPTRVADSFALRRAVRDVDILLGDADVKRIALALVPLAASAFDCDFGEAGNTREASPKCGRVSLSSQLGMRRVAAASASRRLPGILEGVWAVEGSEKLVVSRHVNQVSLTIVEEHATACSHLLFLEPADAESCPSRFLAWRKLDQRPEIDCVATPRGGAIEIRLLGENELIVERPGVAPYLAIRASQRSSKAGPSDLGLNLSLSAVTLRWPRRGKGGERSE